MQKQNPSFKKAFVFSVLIVLALPLFYLVVYNAKTRMQKQAQQESLFESMDFDDLTDNFSQLEGLLSSSTEATSVESE